MESSGIRWKQRFSNFKKALSQLREGAAIASERDLNNLEKQGLIHIFEYNHELAWQVMKDYFRFQGNPEIRGSRDATREAFKNNLIDDGEVWMDMIQSRNLTSHTYNEEIADEIAGKAVGEYIEAFEAFCIKMEQLAEAER